MAARLHESSTPTAPSRYASEVSRETRHRDKNKQRGHLLFKPCRHALSERRRQKLLALHERAMTAPAKASRSQVSRSTRGSGVQRSKQAKLRTHSLNSSNGFRQQRNNSSQPNRTHSNQGAATARRRMKFSEEDAQSWTMTPQTSSARQVAAPIPSYVVRNRKLAVVAHERPPERLVRIRSDIGQFYRDATNGVDRYNAHDMHANMSSGMYRRKKSGMSAGVFAHMSAMPQAPGLTGTFRLKSRGFDTFDEQAALEFRQ